MTILGAFRGNLEGQRVAFGLRELPSPELLWLLASGLKP